MRVSVFLKMKPARTREDKRGSSRISLLVCLFAVLGTLGSGFPLAETLSGQLGVGYCVPGT